MTDDLNQPLGQVPPTGGGSPARFGKIAFGALGVTLIGVAYAAFALLPRDPYGGEPHAVARIEPAKPPQESPPPQEPPPREIARNDVSADDLAGTTSTGRGHIASVSAIEQQSGVKVTRSGGADAPGAVIIQIDPPSGVRLAPAPDRRVVEKGRFGPLPRIGADGAKPMDIYARPFVTSVKLKAGAPKIALVVGGVGLDPATTAAAIDELPEAVTLAFAPYGAGLDPLAQRARERGHEILLQAPMEPFDYPHNNPGPHTLLTGGQGGADLTDLHWLMSRLTGYAGVMNFLGGRFTADEQALAPVLADIAQRGLFFLDDGAAPQSIAASLAPRMSAPYARVDIVLDARETPQSLDAALAQLETLARQHGSAIGFANARPATIARLSRFASGLERRGVALAPVTATLSGSGPSAEAKTGSPK